MWFLSYDIPFVHNLFLLSFVLPDTSPVSENRVLRVSTFGRKDIHFKIYTFNQDGSNLFIHAGK